jgi:hypothetical protein
MTPTTEELVAELRELRLYLSGQGLLEGREFGEDWKPESPWPHRFGWRRHLDRIDRAIEALTPKVERDREARHGAVLFRRAKELGRTDEAEGPLEYLMRKSYELGAEDARENAARLTTPAEARLREALSVAESDVVSERSRQVMKEGWTPEHDDEHGDGSLAIAAACYAMFASVSDQAREATTLPASLTTEGKDIPGRLAWLEIWPWDRKWWKPKDRRYDLVRAAALIVAEIERLDRRALSDGMEGGGS